MERVPAKELRQNQTEYLDAVKHDRRRFTITRWGRGVAKLVPIEPKPGTRYRVEMAEHAFTADSLHGLADMIGDEVDEARAWIRQGALVIRIDDPQGFEETRYETDEIEVEDDA